MKEWNVTVVAVTSDNASVNISAMNLIVGNSTSHNPEQNNKCKMPWKVQLFRCAAHVIDLIFVDFIKNYLLDDKIKQLLAANKIDCRICPTRWTWYETALEKLEKINKLPDSLKNVFQIGINKLDLVSANSKADTTVEVIRSAFGLVVEVSEQLRTTFQFLKKRFQPK